MSLTWPSGKTAILLDTLDLLPADTTFTVTYTDGVEDAVIFNDQATSGLLAGDATPAMADPVREGYRFDGWEPAVAETVTADVTYTAKWTKLYTIVFLDGTEENNVVLSQQVAEGENTPLPANPTREGYDFDAWIDQNGNGWGDSASKPVTGDATYTATWRAHDAVDGTADTLESGENTGVRVVVTNGVDGGVIGESTSQTIMDAYAYVQSLAAPTHPSDPAMTFAGWSDFHYDDVNGVVTFEATWKPAEEEQPADTTAEQPADTTAEQPADTTTEQPADATAEQPADTTAEQPADTTTEQPADTNHRAARGHDHRAACRYNRRAACRHDRRAARRHNHRAARGHNRRAARRHDRRAACRHGRWPARCAGRRAARCPRALYHHLHRRPGR